MTRLDSLYFIDTVIAPARLLAGAKPAEQAGNPLIKKLCVYVVIIFTP
jgi:hypothetical protein